MLLMQQHKNQALVREICIEKMRDAVIADLKKTVPQDKLDAFIRLLGGYEILELARTGITSLSRGSDDVRYL